MEAYICDTSNKNENHFKKLDPTLLTRVHANTVKISARFLFHLFPLEKNLSDELLEGRGIGELLPSTSCGWCSHMEQVYE